MPSVIPVCLPGLCAQVWGHQAMRDARALCAGSWGGPAATLPRQRAAGWSGSGQNGLFKLL